MAFRTHARFRPHGGFGYPPQQRQGKGQRGRTMVPLEHPFQQRARLVPPRLPQQVRGGAAGTFDHHPPATLHLGLQAVHEHGDVVVPQFDIGRVQHRRIGRRPHRFGYAGMDREGGGVGLEGGKQGGEVGDLRFRI
jgi:hypothetical protein